MKDQKYQYQSGFGNHFVSEAIKGALPEQQNIPQRANFGLYPEQLSGSAFTAPRHENLRSWLYRIRPSAGNQQGFQKIENKKIKSAPFSSKPVPPTQFRWLPPPLPQTPTDFVDGLFTMVGNGIRHQMGCAAHIYVCNQSMKRYFYNADGDLLIVPQQGTLLLRTEFGNIEVTPLEIAVVPKGVRFQVIIDGPSRGYVCENFGPAFRLPDLGPIGANGLANPRDFKTPVAAFEEKEGPFELVAKFQGNLWSTQLLASPLDVVAWHGNYAPYKYDLRQFQTINTVSYDHPDPSIFTVLTSPSHKPGTANIDFVIFPPRWMVAEKTFRPPYFHRNCMSEFMGLIEGTYDAKSEGFSPGGASLHNAMTPHGPDVDTYEDAIAGDLNPTKIQNTMAFMFESSLALHPTDLALECEFLDRNYLSCWQGFKPANLK